MELAFSILLWLVKAKRVLTAHELQLAVPMEHSQTTQAPEEQDLLDKRTLLDVCASLVTIDEKSDEVRLAHYTVQEYLLDNALTPENVNVKLALACIKFLLLDICSGGLRFQYFPPPTHLVSFSGLRC